MSNLFISRPDSAKSLLFLELLNFAHKELGLFNKILETLEEKKVKIEIIADLIGFIYAVQPVFHHTFAIDYLQKITHATL